MFPKLLFYLLQLFLKINADLDCKTHRPTNTNLQSAVCCFPPWTVRDHTLPVENLDNYVNEIMQSNVEARLFVDITNFRQLNLYNSKHPILLRWPLPVFELW